MWSTGDRERLSELAKRALERLDIEDVYGDGFVRRARGYRGRCPLHGGRDANFWIDADSLAWRCHSQCQRGGSAIDFVMEVQRLREYRDAVLWLAERACLDLRAYGKTGTPARTPKPVRRVSSGESKPEPTYPPVEEVRAVWSVAFHVRSYPPAVRYLRSEKKRLDPELISSFDVYPTGEETEPNYGLLRVMAPHPRFAWQKWWWKDGYRLIAPLVDVHGQVRSFQARNILSDAERRKGDDGEPIAKSRSVALYKRAGLIMACPRARHVLLTGEAPVDWPRGERIRFEVCEGELKYTMRACMQHDRSGGPLVFGVGSGSWTDELTARLPRGSRVWIATDQNPGGAGHATAIVRSLRGRVGHERGISLGLRPEFELFDERGLPAVRLTPIAQRRYEAWKQRKEAERRAGGATR